MQKKNLKPILKWAGGKTQLISEISEIYPIGFGKKIKRYAEPFVGGGAVLLNVLSNYELDEVFINDVNAELINMYLMVRDNVDDLIDALAHYQNDYIILDTERRKKYYYEKRDEFNQLIKNGTSKQGVKSAALFIFLNRTCYNGLYRANKNGLFNVPSGDYNNPTICNENNLRNVSFALSKVQMKCGDYSNVANFADDHTLIYFDPPYRPLKGMGSFTSYTENEFDDNCQRDLANFAKRLSDQGTYFILSNSDPKNVDSDDNFFEELYAEYSIRRIKAKRRINRNPDNRGYITELLIKNY